MSEQELYWKSILSKYEGYRGSEAAFVVKHGLHMETFRMWRKRLEAPSPTEPLFIELHSPQCPSSPQELSTPVLMSFPNGVQVRFEASITASTLLAWAHAFGGRP